MSWDSQVPYKASAPIRPRSAVLNTLQCGKALPKGRRCVKLKGHEEIVLQSGKSDERHSYTWQMGDAAIVVWPDGRTVDMGTGELLCEGLDLFSEGTRFPYTASAPIEVLRNYLPGFREAEDHEWKSDTMTAIATPVIEADYYYHGNGISIGRTREGYTVSRYDKSGKVERIYSVDERQSAVDLARQIGLTAASLKLDVPRNSIKSWMRRGIG